MKEAPIGSIAKHFDIRGEFTTAEPFIAGLIHDTFIVTSREGGNSFRYVLQRINRDVFKDPAALMENIIRITSHISRSLGIEDTDPTAIRVLTVINSDTAAGYYKDQDGNFWRMYNFIENTRTYNQVRTVEQAYETGRMFGWFQKMLLDLPEPPLHDILVDFHNTPKRMQAFKRTLEADVCNRAASVKDEIDFAIEYEWMCDVLLDLVKEGRIPVRIAHNDAKIDNVMFDDTTDKGVCVVDLDIVMPAVSLYDFGDMVRTVVTGVTEDERDLSKVDVQLPLFEALGRGYCGQMGEVLTAQEKRHLVFAAKLITFEQFIRFLGDYLAGDVYYKTQRDGHNLDRSRTQMKLIQSIIAHEDRMNAIVEKL